MTRGIFDPSSDDVERSGSRFTGPDAQQISHMPPDVVDGMVDEDDPQVPLPGVTEPEGEAGVVDTAWSDESPETPASENAGDASPGQAVE